MSLLTIVCSPWHIYIVIMCTTVKSTTICRHLSNALKMTDLYQCCSKTIWASFTQVTSPCVSLPMLFYVWSFLNISLYPSIAYCFESSVLSSLASAKHIISNAQKLCFRHIFMFLCNDLVFKTELSVQGGMLYTGVLHTWSCLLVSIYCLCSVTSWNCLHLPNVDSN